MACRPELYRAGRRVAEPEGRAAQLEAENRRLRRRVKELTAAAAAGASPSPPPSPPPFVKAAVKAKRRKRPGRKAGHPAALRPVPDHVDVEQDVPLPADPAG